MFAKIFSVLLLIIIFAFAYDFLPQVKNWIGRIKIGRVTDNDEWLESVKAVNLKWLSKGAPEVPKNENQRLRLIYKIKNRKTVSTICYWQDAALLKASTKNCGEDAEESVNFLLGRYIDDASGNWKTNHEKIDCAILAYEMLSNEFVDSQMVKPAMDSVAELLKKLFDEYGYIPYNAGIPDIVFVDTIGMVCPFLIKYASVYNDYQYVDIAIKQIAQYYKLGFDEKTKLPFHCANAKTGAHLGICGWGRGCGWWSIGITDSLKELLLLDGFEKEKTLLLKLDVSFLDNFGKYISESGSVNRMVLNSSLQDSSASAMLAYSFAYMYTLTNKIAYRENDERIISYLKTATRRNGVIDYSQGDTMGIGYYSPNLSVVPAAQGFAIAAAEIINK